MIGLKQLIQVAPFPEDSRKELLEKMESLSEDKKIELMETCWALISTQYQGKVQYELQKAMLEMAKGEKTYTKDDLSKIEDNLFLELTNRLQAAGSEDKIEEIRKQLGPIITSNPVNNPVNQ